MNTLFTIIRYNFFVYIRIVKQPLMEKEGKKRKIERKKREKLLWVTTMDLSLIFYFISK